MPYTNTGCTTHRIRGLPAVNYPRIYTFTHIHHVDIRQTHHHLSLSRSFNSPYSLASSISSLLPTYCPSMNTCGSLILLSCLECLCKYSLSTVDMLTSTSVNVALFACNKKRTLSVFLSTATLPDTEEVYNTIPHVSGDLLSDITRASQGEHEHEHEHLLEALVMLTGRTGGVSLTTADHIYSR